MAGVEELGRDNTERQPRALPQFPRLRMATADDSHSHVDGAGKGENVREKQPLIPSHSGVTRPGPLQLLGISHT